MLTSPLAFIIAFSAVFAKRGLAFTLETFAFRLGSIARPLINFAFRLAVFARPLGSYADMRENVCGGTRYPYIRKQYQSRYRPL
jgi:hypothetical protein